MSEAEGGADLGDAAVDGALGLPTGFVGCVAGVDAGAVGGGAVIGAAGSTGITRVYNGLSASIDANTSINTLPGLAYKPVVNVDAITRDKAGSWAVSAEAGAAQSRSTVASYVAAGSLGFAGISRGTGDVEVNNVVSATLSPVNFNADAVSVTARDESNAASRAYGVAAGAGAVGAASSTLRRRGDINAGVVLGGASAATLRSLDIKASEGGSLKSEVYAGTGGVGIAVSGNGADVTDSRNVTANIGAYSNLLVSGAANVTATRAPQLDSQVIGLTVSGGLGLAFRS